MGIHPGAEFDRFLKRRRNIQAVGVGCILWAPDLWKKLQQDLAGVPDIGANCGGRRLFAKIGLLDSCIRLK